MSSGPGRWLVLLATLVTGLTDRPCLGAEPVTGSTSPTGTVRLASGPTAHYAYHYNRNALADLMRAGDAFIARTDAGNLLRFDRTTLALTGEWFGPASLTCLGRGEDGTMLAGFADGRVAQVDPESLAVTELARLTGEVQWVGATAAAPGAGQAARPRLIAVVVQDRPVDDNGKTYQVPSSIVHDLGSGKTYPARPSGGFFACATAFRLDRKHRLWLGSDHGEWGGWCTGVDLDAGQIHPVTGLKIYDEDISPDPAWHGVFGFTELRDGQVWAHGGITHMGSTEGYIWRVDRGKAEELYRLDNLPANIREFWKKQRARSKPSQKDAAKKDGGRPDPADVADESERVQEPAPEPDPLPTDRPYLPITNVIEDPRTGAIVVVSFSDIYRTDARLSRWEKAGELKIGYRWGRPDSVGTYPSVRTVLPLEEPGRPMALLIATRLDGLIRLNGNGATGHALPGQLGADYVGRIESLREGILLIEGSREGDCWQYRGGRWESPSFAPPYEPADPNAIDALMTPGPTSWYESRTFIGRDGSIITVNSAGGSPGTRTVATWRGGKAEILGREVSDINPPACFLTPDGGIWNAEHGALRRLVGGRWSPSAVFLWPRGVGRHGWSGIGRGLRAVNESGPPWILHDPTNQVLIRLAYAPGFDRPTLERLPSTEAGRPEPLEVHDAISWTKGELLLATKRGLRTFTIASGKLATPPLATDGRPVSRLARDGRGRLWLGGDGLAVLEVDGQTFHPLDGLPMLGRSKIEALAADPAHADGAVAAIEGRGIVFVRVEASARGAGLPLHPPSGPLLPGKDEGDGRSSAEVPKPD